MILVEDYGALVGLCTVKDVLHLEPHAVLEPPHFASSWSRSGGLDNALEEVMGEFDGLLEGARARARDVQDAAGSWWRR